MSSKSPANPVVLLVAPDAAAWEVLRAAGELLDQFELTWERGSSAGPDPSEVGRRCETWKAVIVASPDAGAPANWSRQTKLLTIRVPVESGDRTGLALLDDGSGQMPAGSDDSVFATMAIGTAGAKNAALFVVAALALRDEIVRAKWLAFRQRQTASVLAELTPRLDSDNPDLP